MTSEGNIEGCTVCGFKAMGMLQGRIEASWGNRIVEVRFKAAACQNCLSRNRIEEQAETLQTVLGETVGVAIREYRRRSKGTMIEEIETWREAGFLMVSVEPSRGMATIKEPTLIQ